MKNILFVLSLMLSSHFVGANKMAEPYRHERVETIQHGYLITPLVTKIRENRKAERSKTYWIGYVAGGAVGVGLALTAPVSLIGGIIGAAGLLAFPRLKDFWTRLKRTL